jgi:hypothetical protein
MAPPLSTRCSLVVRPEQPMKRLVTTKNTNDIRSNLIKRLLKALLGQPSLLVPVTAGMTIKHIRFELPSMDVPALSIAKMVPECRYLRENPAIGLIFAHYNLWIGPKPGAFKFMSPLWQE